jgi:hypothetical protein
MVFAFLTKNFAPPAEGAGQAQSKAMVFEQRRAMREAGLEKLRASGHAAAPHLYVLAPVRAAGRRGMSMPQLKEALVESTRPYLHRAVKPFNLADYVSTFPAHFAVNAPNELDLAGWHVTAVGLHDDDGDGGGGGGGGGSAMEPLPPLNLPQSMRPKQAPR